jgi:hypothetical protein
MHVVDIDDDVQLWTAEGGSETSEPGDLPDRDKEGRAILALSKISS